MSLVGFLCVRHECFRAVTCRLPLKLLTQGGRLALKLLTQGGRLPLKLLTQGDRFPLKLLTQGGRPCTKGNEELSGTYDRSTVKQAFYDGDNRSAT